MNGELFDKHKEERGSVRRADPSTSHEASVTVGPKLKGLRLAFILRLRELGGEATAQEIGNGNESLRRRASDLHRDGVIVVSGERICKRMGNNSQVYRETK